MTIMATMMVEKNASVYYKSITVEKLLMFLFLLTKTITREYQLKERKKNSKPSYRKKLDVNFMPNWDKPTTALSHVIHMRRDCYKYEMSQNSKIRKIKN